MITSHELERVRREIEHARKVSAARNGEMFRCVELLQTRAQNSPPAQAEALLQAAIAILRDDNERA